MGILLARRSARTNSPASGQSGRDDDPRRSAADELTARVRRMVKELRAEPCAQLAESLIERAPGDAGQAAGLPEEYVEMVSCEAAPVRGAAPRD
jgi:hypothetical protein